jgi:hypothetical protein
MSLVVCNQGERIALEAFLNIAPAADLVLGLYTNNLAPSATDTEDDYVEATGYGYAAHVFVPGDWVITPGNPTEAVYPEVIFTFTGALGNVYGYFVTEDASPPRLAWAERFTDGPYNVTGSGIQIAVTPKITASTT